MESQNIDLELDLDKSLPFFAANRVQLQQALLNLFVNAVDAMNSISDRPRLLTVKSRLHDLHGILITIADSGAGIRPDCVNEILTFFTQRNLAVRAWGSRCAGQL